MLHTVNVPGSKNHSQTVRCWDGWDRLPRGSLHACVTTAVAVLHAGTGMPDAQLVTKTRQLLKSTQAASTRLIRLLTQHIRDAETHQPALAQMAKYAGSIHTNLGFVNENIDQLIFTNENDADASSSDSSDVS